MMILILPCTVETCRGILPRKSYNFRGGGVTSTSKIFVQDEAVNPLVYLTELNLSRKYGSIFFQMEIHIAIV